MDSIAKQKYLSCCESYASVHSSHFKFRISNTRSLAKHLRPFRIFTLQHMPAEVHLLFSKVLRLLGWGSLWSMDSYIIRPHVTCRGVRGQQWMTQNDLYCFQHSIKSKYERSLFIVFMLLNVTSATLVRVLKSRDRCPSWRSALEFLFYTARCWPVSTIDPYVSKCQAKKADMAIIVNTTSCYSCYMGWKSIVIATYSHSKSLL